MRRRVRPVSGDARLDRYVEAEWLEAGRQAMAAANRPPDEELARWWGFACYSNARRAAGLRPKVRAVK